MRMVKTSFWRWQQEEPLEVCDVTHSEFCVFVSEAHECVCVCVFSAGDICQQFTREMLDMYQHFANYKNWHFDILNNTAADYGTRTLSSSPSPDL